MSEDNPRIMLAGSVNSSRKTLEKLVEHDMNVVGVLGLDPAVSKNVSGYVDLGQLANESNIKFKYFGKINSDEVIQYVRNCKPDYMFVVGLSQLVKEPLLSLPTSGCIGFHPTKLPRGRGRGAVAWLILGKAPGAATFFRMGEGMDDGPILSQKDFNVENKDYAQDVIDKIVEKIGDCLDELLPQMKSGSLKPVKQDHSKATYLGKRNPEDGWIDWQSSAKQIVRLIRAVSRPLPGAYSYLNGQKVIIDRASVEEDPKHIGVAGRVLKKISASEVLVQTGDGLVWLHELRGISFDQLRVGQKFSSFLESQVDILNQEIVKLKEKYDG